MFGLNIQYLLYIIKTLADINVFFHEYHKNKKQKKKKLLFTVYFWKAGVQEKKLRRA